MLLASVPYLVIVRTKWFAELCSHIHFVFFQLAHASHAVVASLLIQGWLQVHVTSEQDDHLNALLDQSRVSQQFVHEELDGCKQYPAHPSERIYGYGEMRLRAHESEQKLSDALQEVAVPLIQVV